MKMQRWTPKMLEAHQAKAKKQTPVERVNALGRLAAGTMNKTEEAYGNFLEAQKHAGQVLWYKFESVNFRLADRTFYHPDFLVMTADGNLEVHEVKGFWRDDARVKIKVAAATYPLKFIAITLVKGEWIREYF